MPAASLTAPLLPSLLPLKLTCSSNGLLAIISAMLSAASFYGYLEV